jgi:hypothetical protein
MVPPLVVPAKTLLGGGFCEMATANQRVLIDTVPNFVQQEVTLRGWINRDPERNTIQAQGSETVERGSQALPAQVCRFGIKHRHQPAFSTSWPALF